MAQAVRHHTEDKARDEFAVPAVVDRNTFQAALDALRLREKAHMNEGDSITAAADGSRWSRLMRRHRSSAHMAR